MRTTGLPTGFTPHDGCTRATFFTGGWENEIAGALWLVDEGGLSQELVRRYGQVFVARGVIWWPSRCGARQQSTGGDIAWTAGQPDAVHPARQREGVGQQLIASAFNIGLASTIFR